VPGEESGRCGGSHWSSGRARDGSPSATCSAGPGRTPGAGPHGDRVGHGDGRGRDRSVW
jgi:hypothetical protein